MKITKGRLRQIIFEEVVQHEKNKKNLIKESVRLPGDIAPASQDEWGEDENSFQMETLLESLIEELGPEALLNALSTVLDKSALMSALQQVAQEHDVDIDQYTNAITEDDIYEGALEAMDEELGTDTIMSGEPSSMSDGGGDSVDANEEEEKTLPAGVEEKVRQFLETHPTPEDAEVQKLAGQLGIEVSDVEGIIYKMANPSLKEEGRGNAFVIEDPDAGPLRTKRSAVKKEGKAIFSQYSDEELAKMSQKDRDSIAMFGKPMKKK
jgi:hypothetical protein